VIAEIAVAAALVMPPVNPYVPNDGWTPLPQGQASHVGFYTACDHGVRLWMVLAPAPGYVGLTSQPDSTCLAPGVERGAGG
jgi:hypothetical protein